MQPIRESQLLLTRRHFFGRSAAGIGVAALASLLHDDLFAAAPPRRDEPGGSLAGLIPAGGLPGLPHFRPKAKRVIYLFQSGAPSQMDLFDYKPRLADLRGTELPASVRMGQRLTGMTAT